MMSVTIEPFEELLPLDSEKGAFASGFGEPHSGPPQAVPEPREYSYYCILK